MLVYNLWCRFSTIIRIFADQGYRGSFIDWVKGICLGLVVEIVKKEGKSFLVGKKRWIVERTFSWLGRYRRLGCNYEESVTSAEGMIYLAMIGIMTRRVTGRRLHTF
jgi:transposase